MPDVSNKKDLKQKDGRLFTKVLLIVVVLVLLFSLASIFFDSFRGRVWERGSVIGVFVEGSHRGYGDECGQYPITRVRLSRWSVSGYEIYGYDVNGGTCSFIFGNDYSDVEQLRTGCIYKISYHMEYRSSDTTPITRHGYAVIDEIMLLVFLLKVRIEAMVMSVGSILLLVFVFPVGLSLDMR